MVVNGIAGDEAVVRKQNSSIVGVSIGRARLWPSRLSFSSPILPLSFSVCFRIDTKL